MAYTQSLTKKKDAFPSFHRIYIKLPDGYKGRESWHSTEAMKDFQIHTNRNLLKLSLNDDLLYIDDITILYKRKYLETGELNYVKSANLEISTKSNIKILVDPIDIAPSINADKDYQTMVFIGDKQPLFKMKDLLNKQTINILFKFLCLDSYDRSFIVSIKLRFYYNLDTLKGDIIGDGNVGLKDVVALYNHVAGIKAAKYPMAGDINGDGIVDYEDIANLAYKVIDNG